MIYISLYIYGAITSLEAATSFGKNKNFHLFIYLLLLWLLASFRYGVGPDYFSYKDLYLSGGKSIIEELNLVSGQELLFRIIGAAMREFTLSYEFYSSIIALFSISVIGITVKRYSKNPLLSLLIYYSIFYFVWTYSGIRQGLALAIGTYFFLSCLESRSSIKFIFIVLILTFIHASSAVLIVLYFCSLIDLKKKSLIYICLIGIIFSFLPIQDFFNYLNFIPFIDRVAFYGPQFNIEILRILDFKSFARIIFLLFGFVAYFILRNHEIQRKIVTAYIVSFAIYFSLKFSEVLAANLSVYGFVLIMIILPNLYDIITPKFRFLYMAYIYIITSMFLFKNLSAMEDVSGIKNDDFLVPYTHIFDQDSYRITGP